MRIVFVALTAAITLAFVPTAVPTQSDDPPDAEAFEHDVERLRGSEPDAVKARAQGAIDRRLETIERLQARVADHPHVTGPHEDELLAELDRSAAGLRALSADIDQATTLDELRVLVPKIATDFRIYLVAVPKVHQVLGSDSVVAAGSRLGELAESVSAWIDRAVEKGVDTSAADAHLADMTEEIRQALAVGEPVAGVVLGVTAADWPDPAAAVLARGRSDLGEARQLLREARASGHEAVVALREALGS